MLQLTRVHRCFSQRMFSADDCRLQEAERQRRSKTEMLREREREGQKSGTTHSPQHCIFNEDMYDFTETAAIASSSDSEGEEPGGSAAEAEPLV